MEIKILDKSTAEKIAAGEVIENPSSVVKELVENALDAGATRIEVIIIDGGKSSINVTDNGQGIPAGEVSLAFKRFATSKLFIIDDLNRLSSLGFRGEALPSIGAVAKVKMTARTADALYGTRVVFAGGEVLKQEEVGAPPGTSVEVTDLFYNTPGRLKFLRADSAETSKISALMAELALAHPAVAFSLSSGKRKLLSSSGDGLLLHVIGEIYGSETAKSMLKINHTDKIAGAYLSGFTSDPSLNKSSRRWITLVVNGRLIKNQAIVNALERGYGDYLPRQRHPLAVLHLLIPSEVIDVNVHPAKIEIRFQDPENIKAMFYRAVKLTLQGSVQIPGWPQNYEPDERSSLDLEMQADILKENIFYNRENQLGLGSHHIDHIYTDSAHPVPSTNNSGIGSYRLIGQFINSYLVVQNDEDLLLIDQHAAHERIIYQKLLIMKELAKPQIESQVTIPWTIDIPSAWRSRMSSLIPLLRNSGFDLDQIDEDSYVVRAVPFVFHGEPSKNQIYNILEDLLTVSDEAGINTQDTVLKTIACHCSVKAKQPLCRTEMENLLAEWQNTPRAQFCPHGRPNVIKFNRTQIEKGFRRRGS